MKKIIYLFLILLLVGSVYSLDWSKTYDALYCQLIGGAGCILTGDLTAPNINISSQLHYNEARDTSLVGHWQFNNNQSVDSSIYGNDGSMEGELECLYDVCEFDGVDDYVSIPDSTSLRIAEDSFTVSWWVKPTSSQVSSSDMLGTESTVSNSEGWAMRYISGTNWRIYAYNGSDQKNAEVSIPSDVWSHITVVYKFNKNITFYKNGIYNSQVDTPGFDEFEKNYGFVIGMTDAVTREFNGTIDEVKIYSRALSSAEIQVYYDETNKRFGYYNNVTVSDSLLTDYIYPASADNIIALMGGNVGIGTSSPEAKLDIVGANNVMNIVMADATADATLKEARMGIHHYTNSEEPATIFYAASDNGVSSLSFGGGSSLMNAVEEIRFLTAADDTTPTGTRRMSIKKDGNVGIGTTSPTHKLTVEDTSTTSMNVSDTLFVDGSAKEVGIGTSSPDTQLYILSSGTSNSPLRVGASDTGILGEFYENSGGDGNLYIYHADQTRKIQLATDGDSYLNGGNVGIGTTSPTAKLNIDGESNADGLLFINETDSSPTGFITRLFRWNNIASPTVAQAALLISDQANNFPLHIEDTDANPLFTVKGDGNVGISTITPKYKLDVRGNGTDTAFFGEGNVTMENSLLTDYIYPFLNNVVNIFSNLNVQGNVTAENVFLPQYVFSHTDATIPLLGASTWTNLTFDQENADLKYGIEHDMIIQNHTFTVNADGIYFGDFQYDLEDLSDASSDIDVAGRLILSNGTEVEGSLYETGIEKKGVEVELSHDFFFRATAGDIFVFQFIAEDADVVISTHGTFGDHPESATIIIEKRYNLP